MTYKVFISSRNNDTLKFDTDPKSNLTALRLYLKEELEKEFFFGKDFLEISINEKFATDATNDSYNQCLKEIEEADHTIVLLSGSAGWAPPAVDIGICHAEMARAIELSQKQLSILNLKDFINYTDPDTKQKKRDENFEKYVMERNRFNHDFKLKGDWTEGNFKVQLLANIKDIIRKSIEKRIEFAGIAYRANGGGQKMLEWKAMSYEVRNREIIKMLKPMVDHDYTDIITTVMAVPDSMSTPEALSFAGRVFLTDQETIQKGSFSTLTKGPLHFVGVYGSVTESQVRKLLGNPDIVAMKDDFGIYVWERTLNIQMVFLSKCATPEATKTQYNLFTIWMQANGMKDLIVARTEARHLILRALVEAGVLLSK
ncbi:hypothetical protein [Pedobacter sp. BMA]|uniref:hypothetical protein n=1 Tax=Pedobacter sp. BMA TaxID=1663685 RepID=UPI000649CB22|nr:hypothetical protein [Pedobacter sp. BMA]KLT63923.1 hypothetical protein AB669_19530 [Pedobacter sp. BMA]